MGCGTYSCAAEICRKKWTSRRMGLVWNARLAHFAAALLHVVLTVPAAMRPLVTDVKKFRRTARAVVEAWFRSFYEIGTREKVLLLDLVHPAGDKDPAAWAPHANIFLVARVVSVDGTLRKVRAYAKPAALSDLRSQWAIALSGFLGVPVDAANVHLSVLTKPQDRRFALMTELRSFPGWPGKDVSRIIWGGGFGPRVWHKVRKGLEIQDRRRVAETCKAEHRHQPGQVCGAPLLPFAALPEVGRAEVRASEECTGARLVEEWERDHDDHRVFAPGCSCLACARGRRVGSAGRSALRATWRVADFAREVATDPTNAPLVRVGGELHEATEAVRVAYGNLEDLDQDGITVDEAKVPRELFLAFIAQADAAGAVQNSRLPSSKRLRLLLDERQARDEQALRVTGEWQVTMNLAWVRPWSPFTHLYPTLRVGPDTEEG